MKTKSDQTSAAVVLASVRKTAGPVLKKLANLKSIKTQKEFDQAGELVKVLKELDKAGTAKEKAITVPLEKAKKEVINLFKPFHLEVAQAEQNIKHLMLVFVDKARQKQHAINNQLTSGKIKNLSTYARKSAEVAVKNGAAGVRKVWQAEVVNEKKIPREYMVPDMGLITELLREGKTIPGVEWKQVDSISI